MKLDKLRELNEKVIDRATKEIEKDMLTKDVCDLGDMKILSMAIDNVKDTYKIDKYIHEEPATEEKKEMAITKMSYRPKMTNEFDDIVSEIMVKHGENSAPLLIEFMSGAMDDLEVLQPKIYNNLINRLIELKK